MSDLSLMNLMEILNILVANFQNEKKLTNILLVEITSRKDEFLPANYVDFMLILAIYNTQQSKFNKMHFLGYQKIKS